MDLANVSKGLTEKSKIKEAVKHPKHYQGIYGIRSVHCDGTILFQNTKTHLMDISQVTF